MAVAFYLMAATFHRVFSGQRVTVMLVRQFPPDSRLPIRFQVGVSRSCQAGRKSRERDHVDKDEDRAVLERIQVEFPL